VADAQGVRIAVIGAAGFLGRALMRRLQELRLPATAVVRGPAELALDGGYHQSIAPAEAVAAGDFDVVVNLAYPASGSTYAYPARTAEIVDTVRALVRPGGHVIHASTLAVFGLALERRPSLGPVRKVRDDPYVEAKIQAENLLERQQAEHGVSLEILRLGNIWGRASGGWAQPLAQRLLTGRPVAVAGAPGYSNSTDVANAADYVGFLILNRRPVSEVRYHHLAEFSHVKWADWAQPIAERLGVEVVHADDAVLGPPRSGLGEVAGLLHPLRPRDLYRELALEHTAGSWVRSVLRTLPEGARERLKPVAYFAPERPPDRNEQTFLSIMAGRQEFGSEVDPRWNPPVDVAGSIGRVLDWVSGE
jgi:nucleoside-diphosphate-sugar epimerase